MLTSFNKVLLVLFLSSESGEFLKRQEEGYCNQEDVADYWNRFLRNRQQAGLTSIDMCVCCSYGLLLIQLLLDDVQEVP